MTLAVIMKMRQHVGIIIAVIGIAIVSFLLMDAINSNVGLFGGQQGNHVGEVNNEPITAEKYNEQNSLLERRLLYFQGYWQDPNFNWTETQRTQIRDMAWDQAVETKILTEEYNTLGLQVNVDELQQQILSPNPNPQVRNFYSQVVDPNPNAYFDPNQMSDVISQLNAVGPGQPEYMIIAKDYYVQLENFIKEELLKKKYVDLIEKSTYAPTWKATLESNLRGKTASISYLSVPYASVPDEEVKPTEDELKAYLKKHKNEFQLSDSRSIQYAIFDIFPTTKDTMTVLSWFNENLEAFRNTSNDSLFVKRYSEVPYTPVYLSHGDLNSEMADSLLNTDTSTIVGPYLEDGKYKFAKILDKQVMPDSVKIRHIMASAQRYGSIDSAQIKIDSLMGLLTSGTTFDTLAMAHSDDPNSAMNGGELGWVKPTELLVKDFYDAIFIEHNQGETFTVNTGGAIHIVRIDSTTAKSPRIKLALVERTIGPGSETRDSLYNVASSFYTQKSLSDSFEALLAKQALVPRYLDLEGGESFITGINIPARSMVKWAFNAEEGDVQLFKDFEGQDNKYVIAKLTNIKSKEKPEVNDVRDAIVAAVIKEKKAKIIKDKIEKAKSGTTDLNQIASKLNTQANSAENVTFNSQFIEGVGVEPKVAAVAAALSPNKLSNAIEGNNGVYVIRVENVTDAPAVDPAMMKAQLKNSMRGRFGVNVLEEIKQGAEVKDERYKFL